MHNGGDAKYLENPNLFAKAKFIIPVYASTVGYISEIDADICGSLARYIGAGRMNDENEIDNTAGIEIKKKIGDFVKSGEAVAYVHTNDETKAKSAVKNLTEAFKYSDKPVKPRSRILEAYGI